ncbi:MAG: hydantoinase B/oxoprolinase family protein [Deltaproteobacteria bacterium]|nr:hydantoinase B/oxoprolinase family protein [Deltaproteobacteria bacterium]
MTTMTYARDTDIVQRLKPEPMTPEEEVAQDGIEDVDFEIFVHKMNMIALEGKETTMKLGASTGMRWGDVAFGIYTAQGDLSVVATGIWFHAVLGQIPVKYIVKHLIGDSTVGAREGDSFFFNDPFYCGVHGADMGLCVPVFYRERLVCFVGAVVHTGENGGTDPGGMPLNAKSKYDEGLLVPPTKIGENYLLREDLLTMFASMTRDPRTLILDIKARLAACRIAQRRILELIDQQGVDFFVGALRRILKMTGDAARKKIRLLNDGTFRQPRFLDTVGPEEALLKINITLIKKGDKLTLLLEDTSPMLADKPMNTYFQGIIGLAMVYLCGWFLYDLPANNGLLEIMDWEFPENVLVNAAGDVPTALAPAPQVCFVHGIFLCGARMTYHLDPSRAVAAWYQGFGVPYFGGKNQWGETIADITPELNATGCGARPDMDGVDGAGSFFATMSDCSDVETTEADRPLLYLFRNYFKNSYGHGRYRGGSGVGFGLMIHHVPWLALGSLGYGSRFPATMGIFGGYAVPPSFIQSVHGSNMQQLLSESDPHLPVTLDKLYQNKNPEDGGRGFHGIVTEIMPFLEGDTLYIPVGGGAGYGDVLDRDPEAVIKDLQEGMLSHEVAREVYRVAYDERTLRLDREKTDTLRAEAREERRRRGKPYSEFEAQWQKLRPPARILKYFGAYPHPSQGIDMGMPGLF